MQRRVTWSQFLQQKTAALVELEVAFQIAFSRDLPPVDLSGGVQCDGGIVVSIAAFQAVDPGSIPGHRSCLALAPGTAAGVHPYILTTKLSWG